MRGKESSKTRLRVWTRITPAYAGKRRPVHPETCRARDHPRLCGEKDIFSAGVRHAVGSPPPMRGKVFLAPLVLSVIRITPAYAGKSVAQAALNVIMRDHPRLCGEKCLRHMQSICYLGSPPPMRGKVRQGGSTLYKRRITPAYAGKSGVFKKWS